MQGAMVGVEAGRRAAEAVVNHAARAMRAVGDGEGHHGAGEYEGLVSRLEEAEEELARRCA
jgi:hypothetical protein